MLLPPTVKLLTPSHTFSALLTPSLAALAAQVAVVSWVIFATEEIGHIIEEPFGQGLADDPDETTSEQLEVLPLGRYCRDIAADVATLWMSSPGGVASSEMPGAEDEEEELVYFDDVA